MMNIWASMEFNPDIYSFLRPLFLLACLCLTVLIWRKSPLERRIKDAAVVAGIVHFLTSLIVDLLLVQSNVYRYAFHRSLYFGVPVDLHLAWASLWGTGFCLIWDSMRPVWRLWFWLGVVLLTFSWDLLIVSNGSILEQISPHWWKWDLAVLSGLPLVALLFFSLVKHDIARIFRALFYAFAYFVIFYILLPTLILQLGHNRIACPHLSWWSEAVWAIVLFSLPGLWAAVKFALSGRGTPLPLDPTQVLVTSGPYAFVRNPMQLSSVTVAIILAVFFNSIYLWIYCLDLVILLQFTHPWEEAELEKRFGADYLAYATSVRRWVPRFTPYHRNQG